MNVLCPGFVSSWLCPHSHGFAEQIPKADWSSFFVSDTSADESPSFAPNSRLIVYATVAQGREALMTSTVDGRVKARLAGQGGDLREPAWGPAKP